MIVAFIVHHRKQHHPQAWRVNTHTNPKDANLRRWARPQQISRDSIGHHGFWRNDSGVAEPRRYPNTDLKHRLAGTPHAPLPSTPPGSGRRARRLRNQYVKNGVPRRGYLPPGGPCPSAQHHSLHSHTLKRDLLCPGQPLFNAMAKGPYNSRNRKQSGQRQLSL